MISPQESSFSIKHAFKTPKKKKKKKKKISFRLEISLIMHSKFFVII